MTNACADKEVRRKFINRRRYKSYCLKIDKKQAKLSINASEGVTIKRKENISIKDGITVKLVKTDKSQVKLGISAPKDVTVNREEVPKEDQVGNVLSSDSGVINHTKE